MEATKNETLLGGADVAVIFRDGTSETIKVRQLPIRLFQMYLAAIDQEARQVELYCDKPEKWSDTLTNESFELIIEEGERINRDFFSRWKVRREKRQELLPKRDEAAEVRMIELLQKNNPALLQSIIMQAAASNSPTPSPSSPLPAG